jgi:hypothetical protein
MKEKKYTVNQRIKRIEKAIGELYVMIHHISNKLEVNDDQVKEKVE